MEPVPRMQSLGLSPAQAVIGQADTYYNQYHPTGWAYQVSCYYIRYLYSAGKLDWDTYSRLLLTVRGGGMAAESCRSPSHSPKLNSHWGAESQASGHLPTLLNIAVLRRPLPLRPGNAQRPATDEVIHVPYLARDVKRLSAWSNITDYYLGKESYIKTVGFIFFPKSLLPEIEEQRHRILGRRRVEGAVTKRGVLMPKYVRIYGMREML